MKRAEVIQTLINRHEYKTYLEIGVRAKVTFNAIEIDFKEGVDPNVAIDYRMTSDDFFAQYPSKKYDIIFVDGNHDGDFAYRDIVNAIKALNPGGRIVCHDCNPKEEYLQMRYDHPYRKSFEKALAWTGTTWRAWTRLRSELTNRHMYVIDTDMGIGVIEEGSQTLIDPSFCLMNYERFRERADEILNLISEEEFKNSL